MIFIFASLIFLAIALLLLVFRSPSLASNFKNQRTLECESSELEYQLNSYLKQRFPIMLEIFKEKVFVKLVIPGALVFCIFAFVINPLMTSVNFAIILALLMSATYSLRIYYHNLDDFRSGFLSQLKQLFFNVRNQLSTGVSLDQALSQNLDFNYKQPLKREFNSFMNISQANLIGNFPNWLIRLQNSYKLKGLDRVAQILKLELKYNNNQEEAFEKAIESISQRVDQNTKQKNSVFISLTTIDFLTLMFFGIMFFVIPGLATGNSEWWLSFRRELVVFGSASILWLLYFMSLIFLIRRVA
jgi:hypothetical protein